MLKTSIMPVNLTECAGFIILRLARFPRIRWLTREMRSINVSSTSIVSTRSSEGATDNSTCNYVLSLGNFVTLNLFSLTSSARIQGTDFEYDLALSRSQELSLSSICSDDVAVKGCVDVGRLGSNNAHLWLIIHRRCICFIGLGRLICLIVQTTTSRHPGALPCNVR